MPGVLEGIKVIGLTTWAAAPSACAMMADWGASVIKVEHTEGGDPQRGMKTEVIGLPPCRVNPVWEYTSRNQQGVALNLTREPARGVAYKLVKGADVFISNLQEPSLERLGMQYETLSKVNPKLVYAQFSGYGDKGPDRLKPGYDHSAFWASSGIMATLGDPDQAPPMQRPAMGDHAAAIALVAGIAGALFARERTGEGQRIDTSLMALGLWLNCAQVGASLISGQDVQRTARNNVRNPLRNVYRCRDGRWVYFAMPKSDSYWPGLCRALGIEHLQHDSRFDNELKRAENRQELIPVLDEIIGGKDLGEWKKVFDDCGLVWAPVNTVKEAANHPQALANEFIREIKHPVTGTLKVVASPVNFSKAPLSLRLPAPRLGEHTEEVLLSLGYKAEEIAKLRHEGAIL
ncbi:MAG: CoA transferase [Chloroflexota bacterium]